LNLHLQVTISECTAVRYPVSVNFITFAHVQRNAYIKDKYAAANETSERVAYKSKFGFIIEYNRLVRTQRRVAMQCMIQ